MPPTPFPAGKTPQHSPEVMEHAKHCGICNGSDMFKNAMTTQYTTEPTEQEEWEPRKGDVVTVKGVVSKDFDEDEGDMLVRVVLEGDGESSYCLVEKYAINFLSRPPAPRKVTMAEVEAAMGGPVEIVD